MIIIIGDSWGVGEWGIHNNKYYCMTGPGIGQYISLHNTVTNLSVGAASNTCSLNRLEHFFKRFTVEKTEDTVYWIVTDPLRCMPTPFAIDKAESIKTTVEFFLNQSLSYANSIAKQNQISINLIGGLCDIDNINLSNYSELNIVVPSWGKLIDAEYCSSVYCYSEIWQQLGKTLTDATKKEEWIHLTNYCKQKQYSASKIFLTDGHHPDSASHRLLRDYLYPEYKHKF
jgi:hypothetical protein